jgi:CheY-like chemotaxis protein
MIKILSLDDNPELIKRQWEDSNLQFTDVVMMEPETVRSLADARRLMEYYQPDVVLVDYYMGGVTGDVVISDLEDRFPEVIYFGNSSESGKFVGLVNVDKCGRKLFDAVAPIIAQRRSEVCD